MNWGKDQIRDPTLPSTRTLRRQMILVSVILRESLLSMFALSRMRRRCLHPRMVPYESAMIRDVYGSFGVYSRVFMFVLH